MGVLGSNHEDRCVRFLWATNVWSSPVSVSEDDAATWVYLVGIMMAIPVLIFGWARKRLSPRG